MCVPAKKKVERENAKKLKFGQNRFLGEEKDGATNKGGPGLKARMLSNGVSGGTPANAKVFRAKRQKKRAPLESGSKCDISCPYYTRNGFTFPMGEAEGPKIPKPVSLCPLGGTIYGIGSRKRMVGEGTPRGPLVLRKSHSNKTPWAVNREGGRGLGPSRNSFPEVVETKGQKTGGKNPFGFFGTPRGQGRRGKRSRSAPGKTRVQPRKKQGGKRKGKGGKIYFNPTGGGGFRKRP